MHKITPNIIAQKGISRTFQNLALFKRMSVLDNILVGRKLHSKANFFEVALQLPRATKEEKQNREKCEEIIKFLEIKNIKSTPVGKLPYGLQKIDELISNREKFRDEKQFVARTDARATEGLDKAIERGLENKKTGADEYSLKLLEH